MIHLRCVHATVLSVLVYACSAAPAPKPSPASLPIQAASQPAPWTHLDFNNDPDDFQFAIVADRTGNLRPGVFEDAVRKLNLLGPEFVMCVGDLIEGYTEDEVRLGRQRAQMDSILAQLRMPFFRVPGNHDITNATMAQDWEKRYGRPYYHFVYRDVLFLCLNSEDPPGGHIGEDQIASVSGALAENPRSRWTLVFLHEPLWLYGEGTGWEQVAALLGDRPYTVFAGHFHSYTKYERSGRRLFTLATTGGGSSLSGPLLGEFDHMVWVTMTDQGPRVANLLLEGIWDEDVRTEEAAAAVDSFLYSADEVVVSGPGPVSQGLEVGGTNPLSDPLKVRWEWTQPGAWKVEPPSAELTVQPGQKGRMRFEFTGDGAKPYPAPQCTVTAWVGAKRASAAVPIAKVRRLREVTVPRLGPFRIDGRDEPGWDAAAPADDFADWQGQGPASPATRARVAHDGRFLYVFARLEEPEMGGLRTQEHRHDGQLWEDDCFDIFVQPPGRGYYLIIVNSEGITYEWDHTPDGLGLSWDPPLEVAAARLDSAWTVEMAIPFSALGGAPSPGESWKGNFCRERYAAQTARSCWSCTFGGFHRPDRFGKLTFE